MSMFCANFYAFFAIQSYHICYNKQMPPIAFLLLCVICLPRVFPLFRPGPRKSLARLQTLPKSPNPSRPLPAPFCPSPNPQKIRDTARRAGAVPAPQAASGRRIRPADELPCGPSSALLLPLHPTPFHISAPQIPPASSAPFSPAASAGPPPRSCSSTASS